MTDSPYDQFANNELILRDYLAADRTVLANERTFLAYIRTALALFAAGATFVQFFGPPLMAGVGWVFIPAGIAVFAIGLARYAQMRSSINKVRQGASSTTRTGQPSADASEPRP